MRILAFGDSITYGGWDTDGGWVERIKRRAHSATIESKGANKLQVFNLGIGGSTSARLLARMELEIQNRYFAMWPFVFIIAVGTNDGRSVNGKPEVSLDEYKRNITHITTIAKKYTDKILFLGLPPLGEDSLDFKGQLYSDSVVENYNDALEVIVRAEGIGFVPIRQLFESQPQNNLFAYDSLHPASKGHEIIAQAVIPYLEKFGIKF